MEKKSTLKTSFVEKTNYIATETGELIKTDLKKHTFIANSKEQFFIGYVSLLGIFRNLNGSEIKVYAYLLEKYNSESPISINDTVRKLISKATGVKEGTINNCLCKLSDSSETSPLLAKLGKGTYQLNPRYAFKGSTKDRNNSLKTLIELGCKNC